MNEQTLNGDGQRVKETTYENLAAGLPATSDDTIYWPQVLTDSDTWADGFGTATAEFAYTLSGLHYAQIDLGAVYTADKVKVWHYANDGRTYHNTKTEVSADGVDWTVIFDSAVSGEYPETEAGRTYTFTATGVRYVRDWANGSTQNAANHWVELEVYGSRTTTHVGNYLEWSGNTSTMVRYYYAGTQRAAMRTGAGSGNDGLKWLLGDHLGSTSITADGASGAKVSELRYKSWGELRYAWSVTLTSYRYTGQRMEGIGLYDYGARWYDPYLNRWIQPDNIVPQATQGTQAFDRYAYANNNPVRYNDPSGHWIETLLDIAFIAYDLIQINQEGWTLVNTAALAADVACAIVPVGTGGGPAVRAIASGGDIATAVAVATRAAAKLPEAIRASQAAEKVLQFIEGGNQGLNDSGKTQSVTNPSNTDPNKISIPAKKSSQFQKRGWTLNSIQNTVGNPAMTRSTLDNPNIFNWRNGNPVTYYYTADGHYVVIDNVTGEVVQVSDQLDPGWRDPFTNRPIEPGSNQPR